MAASLHGEPVHPLRVLVDTNVVLDQLLQREPWYADAQPFWQARDTGRLVAYLPASTITDIFYIGRRHAGSRQRDRQSSVACAISGYCLCTGPYWTRRLRCRAPMSKTTYRLPVPSLQDWTLSLRVTPQALATRRCLPSSLRPSSAISRRETAAPVQLGDTPAATGRSVL